jgi:hypothetical protein
MRVRGHWEEAHDDHEGCDWSRTLYAHITEWRSWSGGIANPLHATEGSTLGPMARAA